MRAVVTRGARDMGVVDLDDPGYLDFEYVRRIGHVVEHALELYLRKPTPPAIPPRRPVGRPRKSAV